MAQPVDLSAFVAHAESQGLSSDNARLFVQVAMQQAVELTSNTNGPVTQEQLVEAIERKVAAEVLEDELSIAEHKADTFKRAMVDLMLAHGDNDDDEEEEEEDNPEADLHDLAVPWEMLFETPEEDRIAPLEEDEDSRRKRFRFTDGGLEHYFGGDNPYGHSPDTNTLSFKHSSTDILNGICQHVELAAELGKHLDGPDVVNLFIASRNFNAAVSSHLLSCIRGWIAYRAPDAGSVFRFGLYRRLLVPDPAGRTWEEQYKGSSTTIGPEKLAEVRAVPGLRYLQLVLSRDRQCREIIAIMARNGHRLPVTMHRTLIRLWLLMEIPTTVQREAWLRDTTTWTDNDIYNVQFLMIKLNMHFNDPIYGPSTSDLMQTILGQKGLLPLWQLLMHRKYTHLPELLQLAVKYNMAIPNHWFATIAQQGFHGVPISQVGRTHLEGWGKGTLHLMRPDELIPVEAIARGLELETHLRQMVLWGYFNWDTGENLVPTEDEMYISDEETTLAHMDTSQHWKRKHALKKRWDDLTEEQRQEIIEDDDDERLRAMAWSIVEDDDDGDDMGEEDDLDEEPYHPDQEMRRGYVLPQPPRRDTQKGATPTVSDKDSWDNFLHTVMLGVPAELEADEELRAQAHQVAESGRFAGGFNWTRWVHGAQRRVEDDESGDDDGDSDDDEDEDEDNENSEDEDEDEDEDEVSSNTDAEGEDIGDVQMMDQGPMPFFLGNTFGQY